MKYDIRAIECVNVDILSFGHIPSPHHLYSWVHYERRLEEAVLAYRSNNGGRKTYLGEMFMSTHSFLEGKLKDPMKSQILHYANNDSDIIALCTQKVSLRRKGQLASTSTEVLPALTKLMPICWPRGRFRRDHHHAIGANVCCLSVRCAGPSIVVKMSLAPWPLPLSVLDDNHTRQSS